jgi:L-asparagine transporter-like permease
VPSRAILIGSSFGFVAVILSVISPTLVFAFLVNASGALMVIIYLLACFAHLRLRRKMEQTSPERLTIRMWLFPGLTYLTIAAMFGVLVAMAVTPALTSQFFASAVVVAIVLLAYWVLRRRRRAPAAVTAP